VSPRRASLARELPCEPTICAKSLTKKRARVYQLDVAGAARSHASRNADFSLTSPGFRDITPRVSASAREPRASSVSVSDSDDPLAPAFRGALDVRVLHPSHPIPGHRPRIIARMCALFLSVARQSLDLA